MGVSKGPVLLSFPFHHTRSTGFSTLLGAGKKAWIYGTTIHSARNSAPAHLRLLAGLALLEHHAQIYLAVRPTVARNTTPRVVPTCVGPHEGGRTCSRQHLPAWPRAGHKIETTVGPPARVSPRPTAWRTGAATARPAKGAACRRRRAGNGRPAVASRPTGSARAPRFVAVQRAARWLAQAAAAKNATDPTPPGTEHRARP